MNKIAILMPVYNEETYLESSIASVLAQSYKDIVLFVSDNHSTDKSSEIIEKERIRDGRVRLLKPPRHLAAFDHLKFIEEIICREDFGGVINIGGHDLFPSNFVEILKASLDSSSAPSLIVPRGARMTDGGIVEGYYPGIPQLRDTPRVTNPFTILSAVNFNVATFSLIPMEIFRRLSWRYPCYGADLLRIAEASSLGSVIVDERAIVFIRDQKTNKSSDGHNYSMKFLGTLDSAESAAQQFDMQLKWINEIAKVAATDYPYVNVDVMSMAMMGCYFTRWAPIQFSQPTKVGGFDKWLASPVGQSFMAYQIGGRKALDTCLSHSVSDA